MKNAPICHGHVLAVALMTLAQTGCRAGSADGAEYRPDDALPRLHASHLAPPGAVLIRDFDIAGDTLVLLDRAGAVHVMRRAADGWRTVRQFGRVGAGPGEFRNPSGISMTATGDIVVVEASRMQTFRSDGSVLSVEPLNAPCPMMLPGIASEAGGFFLSGDCYRTGYGTDTVKAVLGWRPGSGAYRVIAEEVRYTRDGRVGSVFGAQQSFARGADGVHAFGTGTTNCLWRIAVGPEAPAADRVCPAADTLYAAPPPPGLEQRLAARPATSAHVRWPTPLPAFMERVVAGKLVVLLRLFTADSLVLQVAAPDGRDLAVGPHEGLISCKAGTCLWVLEDADPMKLMVIDSVMIGSLLQAAEKRRVD